MKIMVLRNVFIGGKFFAEGERPDVAEKDAKTLIAMKKARALTAGDAEAIEKALRRRFADVALRYVETGAGPDEEDSEKALTGKPADAPEDKGGKRK